MDLEVVGRHVLLFDDDPMAEFVNSPAALVEWNSLSIDRYDVRHLLSAPPPPRTRRRYNRSPSPNPDDCLESELDHERYLDLPSPSNEQDLENEAELENASGYHAVQFSYGNPRDLNNQQNTDTEPGFRPPFSVPEHLLQNLPPTEKVHQIIARTAMFVSKHGGQSEIILRVKQGDNPTFGFLMPDHDLHPYFRFLVDHQGILKSDIDGKSAEENKAESELGQRGGIGGALSLLGSAYGSGEDEEGATEDASELTKIECKVAVNADNVTVSHGSEQIDSSANLVRKDETLSKHPVSSLKERAHVIKRNHSIATVKAGTTTGLKKGDSLGTVPSTVDKLQALASASASASSSLSKVEPPLIVEPPSDMKRVIDKIVEFILRNGKEFEGVLAQQDTKHGRFPFLLPSNLYHSYYLKVLQNAQESMLLAKGLMSEKHDSLGHGMDRRTVSNECDTILASDIPNDSNKKEKFKMVIGKSKKDGQDLPSKATEPQGVSVDAAAAAAILQAATKGIKNPSLEILLKTWKNGLNQSSSSEAGDPAQNFDWSGKTGISVPVAKAIAKTAAIVAANEADSSEASMDKEQKLKAERLKRAKMFAAMIKSGAAPPKSEPLHGLSVEKPESGPSGSDIQVAYPGDQEREDSSVLVDVDTSDKMEAEKKESTGGDKERRSKRSYRSRLKIDVEDYNDEEVKERGQEVEDKYHKHSRKKRSHRSSHHSKDRQKHRKRHSSSMDKDSRRRQDHNSTSDDEQNEDATSDHEHGHSRHWNDDDSCSDEHRYRHKDDFSSDDNQHSRHRHKHDISSSGKHRHSRHKRKHDDSEYEHKRTQHRHKNDYYSDDKRQHSRQQDKDGNSSDDEHKHQTKSNKHFKLSRLERERDLEEGEILAKSDQSKGSEGGNGASREASVDLSKSGPGVRSASQPSETTEVSDDLRAKIRAMLMATM